MRGQPNITPSEFTNFLEQGALLRYRSEWTLVWGPFRPTAEPISHAISIFCPDFYDLEKASYLTGTRAQTFEAAHLKFLCEEFLNESEPKVSTALDSSALSHLNWQEAQHIWQEPLESEYQQVFADIQRRIQMQKIRKAVPVVFERLAAKQITAQDRARMLLSLLVAPPSLYVYGFWSENQGILGATPETLFIYESNEIYTMALAGTCPKAEFHERRSLLEDPKELQEHDFVVQDICEQLAVFGEVQTKGPVLLELPTLWHLKSDITVTIRAPVRYHDLISKLHPTPALGVFPRLAGYHWMRKYPGQEGRARFGAPFAFITDERAVCLVAIRNLQWSSREVLIGSGGGIVADSEIKQEIRELHQKRESVKKILGIIV